MDRNKPLYVASYIKDAVKEASGANPDKSVLDEIQAAILAVLDRGFRVEKGKAVLQPPAAQEEDQEVAEAPKPKAQPRVQNPKFEHAVLIQIVSGAVYSTDSDTQVVVIDFDRIGRMLGNPAYHQEVTEAIECLRQIAPKIKGLDCKYIANEFESIHKFKGGLK